MGFPQLAFPRLRVSATSIAIGPDHTPPGVAQPAESLHGGTGFAVAGNTVIFSAVWQFQWRCSRREILVCKQRFERSSNMCLPINRGLGEFRSSAPRPMIGGR